MPMSSYAAAAAQHAGELLEDLAQEDESTLRAICAELGLDGLLDFQFGEQDELFAYIGATPAERRSRASFRDDKRRALLLLCALHFARRAERLLTLIDRHGLHPGGSYRRMTAGGGTGLLGIAPGRSPVMAV